MPRSCENCGLKMPAFKPRKKADNGQLWCQNCHEGRPGRPRAEGALEADAGIKEDWRTLMDEEGEEETIWDKPWPGDKKKQEKSSRLVVAHDSGDGETIYHCPFCGGGQVVGRSDGTVECDFCQTAFTVQVQPQMNGQPQTGPDGQPLEMPGMPGDPASREAPPAPEDDEFAVIDPEQTSPAAGATPGPSGPAADVNEEFAVLSAKHRPRFFLTGEGALYEDAYIRHLALKYADDRQAVLADIREGRR